MDYKNVQTTEFRIKKTLKSYKKKKKNLPFLKLSSCTSFFFTLKADRFFLLLLIIIILVKKKKSDSELGHGWLFLIQLHLTRKFIILVDIFPLN